MAETTDPTRYLPDNTSAHATVRLGAAWNDGYYTGKRDYAGSMTGGVSISTPNPYLEATDDAHR